MDTELLLFVFVIVVDAVVVVAVVVVAVVFVVLPAPSTIPNYDRMSAATLVANSRSAPRCAPRALPQERGGPTNAAEGTPLAAKGTPTTTEGQGGAGGPCSEPNLNIVKLLKTYLNGF